MNGLATDKAALEGVIDPDAYAAATYTTAWIPAKHFHNHLANISVGDIVATGTVDAKLEQATDASGTGAKDITGKAITQLTAAGSDSNKQAQINLRPAELDVNNGFDHFRLSVTLGTAGADMGAQVFGLEPRVAPASDNDLSTVDEIVT